MKIISINNNNKLSNCNLLIFIILFDITINFIFNEE